MISRDYRIELGLKPATAKVPWPIALVLLGAIAAGAWYGAAALHASGSHSPAPSSVIVPPAAAMVRK
jgi:hypothetical protein